MEAHEVPCQADEFDTLLPVDEWQEALRPFHLDTTPNRSEWVWYPFWTVLFGLRTANELRPRVGKLARIRGVGIVQQPIDVLGDAARTFPWGYAHLASKEVAHVTVGGDESRRRADDVTVMTARKILATEPMIEAGPT